jgi:hypothetical protein
MGLLSDTDTLHELLHSEQQRLRGLRARKPVRLRSAYADEPIFQFLRDAGRHRIEQYEKALQLLFTNGVKLGYLQARFMRVVRVVSLRRMFGETLHQHKAYLLRRFGIKEVFRAVCILFPRRSGKTTVQTIDAAVTAVSQPNGNVVSFNLTGRQSAAWLKQCMTYLNMFKDTVEFGWTEVDRKFPERITIRARAAGTDNTISAYPGAQAGSFDNLRGMGRDLCKCYLDEGAFFDERGLPVMLPLLANGASLIVTSSIAPGGAHMGALRLLDAKDRNGKHVVLELNWNRACVQCIRLGQEDRCEHRRQRPQHFQREEEVTFLRYLMAPFEGAFERELENRYDKPLITPCFNPKHIERLADVRSNMDVARHDLPYVYMALDPSGNRMSDATLLSLVEYPDGNVVIIGADFVNSADVYVLCPFIKAHMLALMDHVPAVRDARFIVAVECNGSQSYIAESINQYLFRERGTLPNVYVLGELNKKRKRGAGGSGGGGTSDADPEFMAGSTTSNKNKKEMVERMRNLFARDMLHFAPQLVSAHTHLLLPTQSMPRDGIVQQLVAFKEEITYPRTRGRTSAARARIRYLGKFGTMRDDWVMVLLIAYFSVELYRRMFAN